MYPKLGRLIAAVAVFGTLLPLGAGTQTQYLPNIAYEPVAPGIAYGQVRIAENTLDESAHEIRIVRIGRNEPTVKLDAAAASGIIPGVRTLSTIIEENMDQEARIVAAVNADFFRMSGQTQEGLMSGSMIGRGELMRSARGRECFHVTDDRTPGISAIQIGGEVRSGAWSAPISGVNCNPGDGANLFTAAWGWAVEGPCVIVDLDDGPLRSQGQWTAKVVGRVREGRTRTARGSEVLICAQGAVAVGMLQLSRGDEVSLELKTAGQSAPLWMAVGGGVVLVRNGTITATERPTSDRQHPRTAIGYNNNEIIIVTCDGRQPDWSTGLYIDQLATLMLQLGCTEALNLDGGGSTTMIVNGRIANRPSGGRQRMISNAVLVRSATAPPPPTMP